MFSHSTVIDNADKIGPNDWKTEKSPNGIHVSRKKTHKKLQRFMADETALASEDFILQ